MPIALPGTKALLLHQTLNQLWNCIDKSRIEKQIGMTDAEIDKLYDEFNVWVEGCDYDSRGVIVIRDANGLPINRFERVYSAAEIRALRNALEVVMLDLGKSDFFNRTGFSLDEAKQLLDELNGLLVEPLHLTQPVESVAH